MSHRERFLNMVRGAPVDRLPFIPRLDIWYNANSKAGTLPDKYKRATLREITDDLDLGTHSIIPAFRDFADVTEGPADIGVGIYRFRALPYSVTFHNVKRTLEYLPGGVTVTEYATPHGTLRTRTRFDERMARDGATLSVTLEHAVKGPGDYAAAAYLFTNAEVTPDYDHFARHKRDVGEDGIAAAYATNYCSPMYYLLKELMPIENFFIELYENPDELLALAERLAPYCAAVFDAALGSPAEVILSGANYDAAITTPPFFGEYIAPELKRQSDALHAAGKLLATHTDGENAGLLRHYTDGGVDIADSICPAPMTRHTLRDVLDAFNGRAAVWGGIPSIAMLEDSMDDCAFESYLDMTLASIQAGDRVVLSIADTTPPGAKFDRILKIKKRADAFRPM